MAKGKAAKGGGGHASRSHSRRTATRQHTTRQAGPPVYTKVVITPSGMTQEVVRSPGTF